jgi:protein-disulfide isomerase
MSREAKILSGVVVVLVGGLIGLFLLTNKPDPVAKPVADAGKMTRDYSHKLGNGALQVVEFGDYQCPACGNAHPIIKRILSEYGDKLTLVFRNYPLPQHRNAQAAAQAAEAAGAQGKYWEMHDKLYDNQSAWTESSNPDEAFSGYAKSLGLNLDTFAKALSDKAATQIIATDTADGNALKVSSTPSIFVADKLLPNYSYETLKTAIDEALKTQ